MLLRMFLLGFLLVLGAACGRKAPPKLDAQFYKSIGFQIREQRILKGISQQELADAVEITQNGLSLIEDGLATPIHTKLIAIQDFLGVEFKIEGQYTRIEDYLKNYQEK